MTKQIYFYLVKIYCKTINQVFEVIIQQIYVFFSLTDNVLEGFEHGLLTGMIY